MILILIKKTLEKILTPKAFQKFLVFKRDSFRKKEVFCFLLKSNNISLLFIALNNEFCLEFFQLSTLFDYAKTVSRKMGASILSLSIKDRRLVISLNDTTCAQYDEIFNNPALLSSVDLVYIECILSCGIPKELRGINKKIIYGKEIMSVLVKK